MHIDLLIHHFSNYLSLDEKEITALSLCVNEKRVKRKQFILQEGTICNHYNFIAKGCVKMYKIDKNGKEHNLQFAIENSWITDIGSFHSEIPSELYIEAIENSVILQIEKPDLLNLYTNFPKFDRNFRVIIEDAFIALQIRVLHNISSTAEEKYLAFIATYPDLFQRISNVQIASYLGVTPEFLSTVRKKISKS